MGSPSIVSLCLSGFRVGALLFFHLSFLPFFAVRSIPAVALD